MLETRNSPDPSVLPQFQGTINNGRDAESRRSRKTDLSKLFHLTLNDANLDDSLLYELLSDSMLHLKQEIQKYNESTNMGSVCTVDEKTRFPNSQYGDNCYDKITKK